MINLQKRWFSVCHQLGVEVDQGVFIKLIEKYSQSHRYYHTLQHLQECFYYFDLIAERDSKYILVEMALWFHDAIYDVKHDENELLSAQWASDCLYLMNVEADDIEAIKQLILVTSHQVTPEKSEEKIIVDVDLAILGANQQRFNEYEHQIRKEYTWVPYFLYKNKRRCILKNFLKKPMIYHTPKLFNLLEQQARINLQAAIFLMVLVFEIREPKFFSK